MGFLNVARALWWHSGRFSGENPSEKSLFFKITFLIQVNAHGLIIRKILTLTWKWIVLQNCCCSLWKSDELICFWKSFIQIYILFAKNNCVLLRNCLISHTNLHAKRANWNRILAPNKRPWAYQRKKYLLIQNLQYPRTMSSLIGAHCSVSGFSKANWQIHSNFRKALKRDRHACIPNGQARR